LVLVAVLSTMVKFSLVVTT
ncbi:glucokinase family protein, partial [Vibrio parahaemolyticus V-223/04]